MPSALTDLSLEGRGGLQLALRGLWLLCPRCHHLTETHHDTYLPALQEALNRPVLWPHESLKPVAYSLCPSMSPCLSTGVERQNQVEKTQEFT